MPAKPSGQLMNCPNDFVEGSFQKSRSPLKSFPSKSLLRDMSYNKNSPAAGNGTLDSLARWRRYCKRVSTMKACDEFVGMLPRKSKLPVVVSWSTKWTREYSKVAAVVWSRARRGARRERIVANILISAPCFSLRLRFPILSDSVPPFMLHGYRLTNLQYCPGYVDELDPSHDSPLASMYFMC